MADHEIAAASILPEPLPDGVDVQRQYNLWDGLLTDGLNRRLNLQGMKVEVGALDEVGISSVTGNHFTGKVILSRSERRLTTPPQVHVVREVMRSQPLLSKFAGHLKKTEAYDLSQDGESAWRTIRLARYSLYKAKLRAELEFDEGQMTEDDLRWVGSLYQIIAFSRKLAHRNRAGNLGLRPIPRT